MLGRYSLLDIGLQYTDLIDLQVHISNYWNK